MITRDLSLAGAVALVGVGLLANAGVHWASATKRVAMAEERTTPGRAQATTNAPGAEASDGDFRSMPMIVGGGCLAKGDPLDWFGSIHELPDCVLMNSQGSIRFTVVRVVPAFSGNNLPIADLNADGTLEEAGVTMDDARLIIAGESVVGCAVRARTSALDQGSAIMVDHCVLSKAPLVSLALAWAPDALDASIADRGWRDMDGDRDLDFVFTLGTSSPATGGGYVYKAYWLENTGFEATQPLVGDLDGDGAVGASDLTMLLGGWTGT